jgi:hypothetical protein
MDIQTLTQWITIPSKHKDLEAELLTEQVPL